MQVEGNLDFNMLNMNNPIINKRIELVAQCFYFQKIIEPTIADFENWIQTLDEPKKLYYLRMGQTEGVLSVPFRKYWLILNGYSLDEYMIEHLTEEEYIEWRKKF